MGNLLYVKMKDERKTPKKQAYLPKDMSNKYSSK